MVELSSDLVLGVDDKILYTWDHGILVSLKYGLLQKFSVRHNGSLEMVLQITQYIFKDTYSKPPTSNRGLSGLAYGFKASMQFHKILVTLRESKALSNIRQNLIVNWV